MNLDNEIIVRALRSRVDFLSGLVAVDGTMIALVDLPNLLASNDEAESLKLSA